MTSPHRGTPTDDTSRRRPRTALAIVLSITTLLLSSCTFHTGKQLEVDYFGSKYRFYVYEKPSHLLHLLKLGCINDDDPGREQWGRCSLTHLRNDVDVPALTKVDWNHFTEGGQWDDCTDAVENLEKGTIRTEAGGDKYIDRCAVGDHTTFGSYNWTFRLT